MLQDELGVPGDRAGQVQDDQRRRRQAVPVVRPAQRDTDAVRADVAPDNHGAHERQLLPAGDVVRPVQQVRPQAASDAHLPPAELLHVPRRQRPRHEPVPRAQDDLLVDEPRHRRQPLAASRPSRARQGSARAGPAARARVQRRHPRAVRPPPAQCKQLADAHLAADAWRPPHHRAAHGDDRQHGQVPDHHARSRPDSHATRDLSDRTVGRSLCLSPSRSRHPRSGGAESSDN